MTQPPKPTELLFTTGPSVLPALVALGLVGVVVGLYAWWPYSVAGGILAVTSIFLWLRGNRGEIARMPREQHTDTAPIPLSGQD